jgi:hypothetical protein
MLRLLRPLIVLPFVLAACGGGALDSASFQKEAESIQSVAAEGALLARDVAEGRSVSTFARVRASELGQEAESLARELDRADATAEVRTKLPQAVRLSRAVAAALARLASDPDDHGRARRIAAELEEAADSAADLAGA